MLTVSRDLVLKFDYCQSGISCSMQNEVESFVCLIPKGISSRMLRAVADFIAGASTEPARLIGSWQCCDISDNTR